MKTHNFANHNCRIKTQRVHDAILFQMLAVLKSTDLGIFYEELDENGKILRDKKGKPIMKKEAFFFRESDKDTPLLRLCDAIMYKANHNSHKNDEILFIEMKTKLVNDFSKNGLELAKQSIYRGPAEVYKEIYNHKFLVIVGLYTYENRHKHDFTNSKIMFYFGDKKQRYWSREHTMKDWYNILLKAHDISSLFNLIYNDISLFEAV